ncbi:hypothetical protein HYN43_026245 [Mucilaginibacter celer]|uniref:Uncharacterized protein n=1 Tax=Mucilaginibacter celer TaxID=2305508 RepID=A0A494VWT7_9SPHI|nr:hypothetical protein HYN43_026245 [Mucilaginibacter celer]
MMFFATANINTNVLNAINGGMLLIFNTYILHFLFGIAPIGGLITPIMLNLDLWDGRDYV